MNASVKIGLSPRGKYIDAEFVTAKCSWEYTDLRKMEVYYFFFFYILFRAGMPGYRNLCSYQAIDWSSVKSRFDLQHSNSFIFSLKHPDWLWVLMCILSNGHLG